MAVHGVAPAITVCALVFLWSAALNLLETGTNIFGLGLLMGIFLFLLNCFLFYWHITLLANSTEKPAPTGGAASSRSFMAAGNKGED